MKTKTIEVLLEDYCPDDCAEFSIDESIMYVDGKIYFRQYKCEHYSACEKLMEYLKTKIPVL